MKMRRTESSGSAVTGTLFSLKSVHTVYRFSAWKLDTARFRYSFFCSCIQAVYRDSNLVAEQESWQSCNQATVWKI